MSLKFLHDYSFLSRGWFSVRSKLSKLLLRRQIFKAHSKLDEEGSRRVKLPLFRFDSPVCLREWGIRTDEEIGGDSVGEVAWTGTSIKMTGKIDAHDANRLIYLPNLGIKTQNGFQSIGTHRFNILNLKVKTNGDAYRVVLKLQAPWVGDYNGEGVIVTQSRQWEELQIPINSLQATDNIMYQSKFDEITKLNDVKFMGLSIFHQSSSDKQVELELKEVNLVYEPDAEAFAVRFRRKTFIKPLRNYGQPSTVDDGRDIFHIK